jgi:hypothetical protein
MADTNDSNEKPLWNSLERAKLFVSVLQVIASVLVSVAIFYYTQNAQKTAEVAKQRTEIWKSVAEEINEIYSYQMYVGDWKKIGVQKIVDDKRSIDKKMYSYRSFFTEDFFGKYLAFMDASFRTGNRWGEDAKVRSYAVSPRDQNSDIVFFTDEDNRSQIAETYKTLIAAAGAELNVKTGNISQPSIKETPGRLPHQ